MTDEANIECVGRLALLASAIAQRSLKVEPAQRGEPTWTDGKVVFVDAHKHTREQIESLAVQASLLSAGSLELEVVQSLARRPALTLRYLAVEGHRALTEVEHLLPLSIRSLIRADVASLTRSPAASLAVARSGAANITLPDSFGAILPMRLLPTLRAANRAQVPGLRSRHPQRALVERADDATTDAEPAHDGVFPHSLGGGGAIGKLLARLLKTARHARGSGSPSGDAPTHFLRSNARRGGLAFFTANPDLVEKSKRPGSGRGVLYPEWDVHARAYREDWCTVLETQPSAGRGDAPFVVPDHSGLRRALARIGLGIDRYGRQPHGDDIDLDALVEARVEILAGASPDDAIFVDSLRRRRDLSVLVLLDISGSAAETAANGKTVHTQQRSAAAALMLALHELGDRVALYAYHSQGRATVHVAPVKRFGEHPGALAMQRLRSLEPGAFSRLGAAIRHGTAVLKTQAGTPRQLLVVLSDGLAYDHGYELTYGAADARRALSEARTQGVGCLCLSVGASTDPSALRRVFGASAHAALPAPEGLEHVIGPLFRSAIRSAEIRRDLS